jgi:hypothetical protein
MAQDKSKDKDAEIELRPDGWRQFKRAVDAAVKSGPKHRTATDKNEPRKPLGKARSEPTGKRKPTK